MRQVILTRNDDGRFTAEVPSLPGCVSEGETRDETLKNIGEAAELWLDVLRQDRLPLPPEDSVQVQIVML